MNTIRHVVEPARLTLSWQPPNGSRARLAVGRLFRIGNEFAFEYLIGTNEFTTALQQGFQGYPAFAVEPHAYSKEVLDVFMTRLPNRTRPDFRQFLEHHRLPVTASFSDFALLGYTGAKLPSDSFELVPEFASSVTQLELIVEVCGFRHQDIVASTLAVGMSVTYVAEPNNEHDPNAVAICVANCRIGYVNRILAPTLGQWLTTRKVAGSIDRINGRAERPLIYVFTQISISETQEALV